MHENISDFKAIAAQKIILKYALVDPLGCSVINFSIITSVLICKQAERCQGHKNIFKRTLEQHHEYGWIWK